MPGQLIGNSVNTLNFDPVVSTAMHEGSCLLMSVKPRWSEALFARSKIFELRSVLPKRLPRRVFVYESSPVSAITGFLIVDRVLSASPASLWHDVSTGCGASEREYFEYFGGASVGYAFAVKHAVRFPEPICLSEIYQLEPSFRAPQNFAYLDGFHSLRNALDICALKGSLKDENSSVQLSLIEKTDYALFIDLVNRHISKYYMETGSNYARKLLAIHRAGEDVEGILTQRKFLFRIVDENGLLGFTAITEKAGGSVKIGPTALKDEWISKGIGKSVFPVLTAALERNGYRNAYFTVSAINQPVLNIFLPLGYRVEAHMSRQYHEAHDELALSKVLNGNRVPPKQIAHVSAFIDRIELVEAATSECAKFLHDQFTAVYCEMPSGWAERQIKEAVHSVAGAGSNFKPRFAFAAYSRGEIVALCLCLIKRGGSTKLFLLSKTDHQPSLSRFIAYVEQLLAKVTKDYPIRRFYTHISDSQIHLYRCFREQRYGIEGCMTRPYNDHSDMFVMAKSSSDV